MNKVFKVVWSESTGTWVAVSEITKAHGKTKSKKTLETAGLAIATLGSLVSMSEAGAAVAIGSTGTNTVSTTGVTAAPTSIAIGTNADAGPLVHPGGGQSTPVNTIAIGNTAVAKGTNTITIGTNATVRFDLNANNQYVGTGGTGHVAYESPYTSFVVGTSNTSSNKVLQLGTTAIRSSSIAIGANALSSGGGVALGSDATVDQLGAGEESRSLGVAIGSAAKSLGGGVVIGAAAETRAANAVAVGRQAVAQGKAAQAYGVVAAAVGEGSLAMGQSATSLGERSIAIGMSKSFEKYDNVSNVYANGTDSISIGSVARTTSNDTIALGSGAKAGGTVTGANSVNTLTGLNATAIGKVATASHNESIAIGTNATSNALGSIVMGANAHLKGNNTAAITVNTNYKDNGDAPFVVIGYNSSSQSRFGDTIVGSWAKSENPNFSINQATAVGSRSVVYGDQGVALGADTVAIGNSSVAIGGDDLDKAASKIGKLIGATVSSETNPTEADITNVTKLYKTFRDDLPTNLQNYINAELPTSHRLAGREYPNTAALGDASLAIGTGSQTLGAASNAIGANALAKGLSSTAIGTLSRAWGESSIAIGTNANASGKNAIAVGLGNQVSGDNSGAFGDPSIIAGTNSYSMGNNHVIANNTDNAISIGGQNKIGGDATRTATGVVSDTNVSNVTNAATGANRSMVIGFNNTVQADDVMVLGNNISATGAVAGSVILGQNAKTAGSHAIATVTQGTVNGITYGTYRGAVKDAGRFVSVGAVGDERKIINVAAGNISSSSTEAINGSQLYLTQRALGNVAQTTADNFGGGVTVGADGNLTRPSYTVQYANGSNYNVPSTSVGNAVTNLNSYINQGWQVLNGTDVVRGTVTPGDKVKFVGEGGTTVTVDQETAAGVTTVRISAPAPTTGAQPTTITAGDNVKVDGSSTTGYTISANDTQASVSSTDKTVKITTTDNTNGTKNYDLAVNVDGTSIVKNPDGNLSVANTTLTASPTTGSVSAPTTPAGEGDKLVNATTVADAINKSGFNLTVASGTNGTLVNPGDTVDLKNTDGNIVITKGTTDNNVSFALNNTVTIGNTPTGTPNGPITIDGNNGTITGLAPVLPNTPTTSTSATAPNPVTSNQAASIADVLNTGWNVQENNTAKDFVKAFDTVNFANGTNTVANVTVSEDGTTSTVKYDVKVDGSTIVNNGDSISVANTTLPTKPGEVVAKPTNTADGNKFVNASDLADTLNNLGFNVEADKVGSGTNDGAKQPAKTAVKTGDTVKFIAGNSINIEQDGQNFTISAKVDSLPPENTTLTVSQGPTDTNSQTPAGKVEAPTTTEGNKLVNATTVADAINSAGWQVFQTDSTPANLKDTVTAGDKVVFADGKGTTANVNTVDNVTTIKFDINTATVNTTPTAQTAPDAVTINNGKAAAPTNNPNNSYLTTGDVVNLVNNVAWTAKRGTNVDTNENTGDADTQVRAGDSVTFTAGKNLALEKKGGEFIYATKDDVTFTSVNTNTLTVPTTPAQPGGTSNPVTINNNGISAGDKPITNVSSGLTTYGPTEAPKTNLVNLTTAPTTNAATVGDLQKMGWIVESDKTTGDTVGAVTATAYDKQVKNAEQVKFVGTGAAKVSGKTGTDGVSTITVHVDESKVSTGSITVNDGADPAKPAGTVTGDTTGGTVATVTDVADAINKSGFNLTVASGTNGTLVNPGDTVDLKNTDGNIVITKGTTDNNVSFALNNTVTIGNTTTPVSPTNNPITIDSTTGKIDGLTANLPDTYNQDVYNTDPKKPNTTEQKLPETLNVKNAATVGDILNSGWNVQENGAKKDFVKAYDTVNFANGTNTVANVTVSEDGTTSTVKYDVKVDGSTIVNNGDSISVANTTLPVTPGSVVEAPKNGDETKFVNAGDLTTALNNLGFNVEADKVGSGTNDGAKQPAKTAVKTGDTVKFIAGNSINIEQDGQNFTISAKVDSLPPENTTLTVSQGPTDTNSQTPAGKVEAPTTTEGNKLVNATTVADAINSAGWQVFQTDSTPANLKDTVTAGDKVVFADGKGTTANVNTVDNVTTVKFDINTATVNTTPTAQTAPDAVTINNGKAAAPTNNPNNSYLTTGDVVNLVNNVAWTAKRGTNVDTNENTGDADTQVRAGDSVTFTAGKNLALEKKGGEFIYATKDDVTFTSVNTNTLTVPTTPAQPGGSSNPVTINKDGISAGDKPITNVSSVLPTYTDAPRTDLVNLTNAPSTNAATVGDLQKMGWIVESDKTTGDTVGAVTATAYDKQVKNAEQVKFVGTGAAKVSGKTTDGVSTITVHVDESKVSTGSITVNDGADPAKPAGTVTGDTTGGTVATVTDVANAINNSGFKVTDNGKPTNELLNAGETLNFVNGTGTTAVVDTKDGVTNVTFNSAVAYVNSPNTADTSSPTNTVSFVGSDETKPVNVQNVNSGVSPITNFDTPKTPDAKLSDENKKAIADAITNATGNNLTNAVNVGDVQAAAAAAKTEVKSENATIAVTSTTAADGHTVYNVEVANTTLTVSNGTTATGAPSTTPAGKVEAPKSGDENKVVNAKDLADAINNSGFTVTSDKVGSGVNVGSANELVNAGETVKFVAGDNINIIQDGANFTFATSHNPTFENNVTIGGGAVDNQGNPLVKVGDNYYNAGDVVNGVPSPTAQPVTPAAEKAPSVTFTADKSTPATNNPDGKQPTTALNVTSTDGQPTQITGVGSTLNKAPVETNPLTTSTTPKSPVDLVDLVGDKTNPATTVNPNSVATVGDLQNMGWVVSTATGEYKDVVKNANEVKFIGAGGATVTGKTNAEGVREITIDVQSPEAAQLPVVYTNKDGDKVVKADDGKYYKAGDVTDGKPNNNAEEVEAGDIIASMNTAGNDTKAPMSLSNVQGNLTPTYNVGDNNIGTDGNPTDTTATQPTTAQTTPTPADVKNMYNNAATVGDVLNAGWNLQENGTAKDFIKAYDTVNFVNGTGTTANVTVDANGTVANVTYHANVDGSTVIVNSKGQLQAVSSAPVMGTTDAIDGKAEVGKSPVYTETATGDVVTERPDGTFVKADGTVVQAGDVTSTPTSDAGKAANVGDIVETINKTGFNISGNGGDSTLVNPGEKIDFINGNGTTVTLTTDPATGNSTIKVDSPIAYVNSTNPTDASSPTNTSKFVGAEPVQVQNVASGVRDNVTTKPADAKNPTPAEKANIANAINAATGDTLTNVANIGDLQAAAGAAKTEVKSENATIAVTSTTAADGHTVYNVEVANTTLTVSNGTTATGAPSTTPAGKVEAPKSGDENKVVNAKDLADAINNSGFTVTSDKVGSGVNVGSANELVNAGETVKFVAGDNINIIQDGANFTFATSHNPTFENNVTIGGGAVDNQGNPLVKVGDNYYNAGDVVNGVPSPTAQPVTPAAEKAPSVTFTADKSTPATNNPDGKQPTTALNVTSTDGQPTQITGVGSTLNKAPVETNPLTTSTTPKSPVDLVDLVGDKTNPATTVNPNSVATVGDLQNMGWVVSTATGEYKDVVKNANEVKFIGAGGATVTGKTNAEGVREITIDVQSPEAAQLPVVYTNKDGDKVVKADDGKYYKAGDVTDGKPNNNAEEVEAGDIIASMNTAGNDTKAPMSLSNVQGNLTPTYNVGDNNIGTDGNPTDTTATQPTTAQTTPTPADVKNMYNNAATVGDVLNAGWNLQENGTAKDFIKAYDTVNFVNGTGTTANVTVDANGTVANVTYHANVDGSTVIVNSKGQLQAVSSAPVMGTTDAIDGKAEVGKSPVYTETATGDVVTERPDGTFVKADGTVVQAGDVTSTPTSDAGKAANVGDIVETINKTGFNISGNGGDSTLVNPGEKIDFINGNGTTVTLTTDPATGNSTIKVDSPIAYVNSTNPTDASSPTNTSKFVGAEPVQVQNVASGVRDNVTTKPVDAKNPTPAEKANIANAINAATGDTLTNVANIGDLQAAAGAAKTEVEAGTNMNVTSDTGANGQVIYTVATKDDVKFNTTTIGGNTANNNTPITIGTSPNGNNTISGLTGNLPDTYNRDEYNTNNSPVTQSAPLPSNLNVTNAATVGDILNSGWNIQENANARDFVKAYDTVNFVNGTGTTANVSVNENGTVANVTYHANVDGSTVIVNSKGQLQAVGSAPVMGTTDATDGKAVVGESPVYTETATGDVVTQRPDGTFVKVDGTVVQAGDVTTTPTSDAGKAANVGDIVETINKTGFNISGNGGDSTLVNPGEKIDFINGNGTTVTLTTDPATGNSTIKVDSPIAYVNPTNPTDASSPTNTSKFVGAEPVQVQNVASGVRDNVTTKPVDAKNPTPAEKANIANAINAATGDTLTNVANIGDLQAAAGAAKTEVEAGTNMNVTSDTGANGQVIYTVATKDDVKFNTTTIGGNTANNNTPITIGTSPNGNNTISGLTGNLPDTYNRDEYNTNNSPVTQSAPLPSNLNVTNAATVGDILNSGWNIQENANARDFVKAYDTVNFVNGTGTTANVSVNENGTVANVTYHANVDGSTVIVNSKGQLQAVGSAPVMGTTDATDGKAVVGESPVYTETATGDVVTQRPDGTFVKVDGTVVQAGDVTTTPTSDAGKAANVGDIVETINKTGFNISGNGQNETLVNPGEKIDFINGNGTTVTLTTDAAGNSTIKVDSPIAYVNSTNPTDASSPTNTSKFVGAEPVQVQNVASGVRDNVTTKPVDAKNPTPAEKANIANAINAATGDTLTNVANIGDLQAAAGAAKTEVKSENATIAVTSTTATDGHTIYNVEVANTTLTVSNGTTATGAPSTTPAGKVEAPKSGDENKVVNAKDLADVINNAGFTLSANNANGSVVNPGEVVDLNNTDGNIVITKATDNNNVTFNLADTVTIGHNSTTAVNPITINSTTGKIDGLIGNLAPTYNAGDNTIVDGKPTDTPVATPSKSAPAPTPAEVKAMYNNAATVGDVLNAGWNVQGNGEAKDFVKPYDTVNFVNGTGTTAVVDTDANGTVTNITFNSALAYVDAAGNTTTTDGKPNVPSNTVKLVGGNQDAPVTITGATSGLTPTPVNTFPNGIPTGTTGTPVPANLINFNNHPSNPVLDSTVATVGDLRNMGWVVSAKGNSYSDAVKSANEVEFVGADGVQVVGKTEGNKRIITISGGGGSGALVNGSPNVQVVNNPITTASPSGVGTVTTNNYTVSAVTAPVSANTTTGKAQFTDPTNPNNANGLVTAGDVVNTINNVSWNSTTAQTGTGVASTTGDTSVKAGDTMTFTAGNNMNLTQDGKNLTIATKDNVTFSNVNITTGGSLNVGPNSKIDAGNNKIENVADGVLSPDSKDAVNGSQLYQVYSVVGGNNQNITMVAPKPDTVTGQNTLTVSPNTTINSTGGVGEVPDSNGYKLVTYNVEGQKNYITNNVIEAVGRMNEQGIQFFHTNDGTGKARAIQGENDTDSSASGAYSTAIGHRAEAAGSNAIAMGRNAKALGEDTISIGNGNIVTGNRSGAFGDPSVITGDASYSIGNDNKLASNDTFALGSNITQTTNNSVFLGTKTGYSYATGTDATLVTSANTAIDALAQAKADQSNATALVANLTKTIESYQDPKSTATAADMQKAQADLVAAQQTLDTVNTTVTTAQNTATTAMNAVKASEETAVKASIDNSTGRTAGTSTALSGQNVVAGVELGKSQFNHFEGGNQTVGVVSVGSDTETRRIQNVAPGLLSKESTDAINGSQLYAIAGALNEEIKNSAARTVTVQAGGTTVTTGNTINYLNGTGTTVTVTPTSPTYRQTSTGDVLTFNPTTNVYTKADGSTVPATDVTTLATPNIAIHTPMAYVNTDTTTGATTPDVSTPSNTVTMVGAPVKDAAGNVVKDAAGNNVSAPVSIQNVASGVGVKQPDGTYKELQGKDRANAVYSATGPTLNNAVNVGDLKAVAGDIHNRIGDVEETAYGGVAQALATAGLPQAYLPGKSLVAVGAGTYKGETGYAVSFSSISDGGNWIIKGTGSGNSNGNIGGSIGVGYQW